MRKLRRLPRGKQSNDLLAVKAECGPGTLISSFEEILQAACNGMLAKESMEKCQEAFDIVTQKLSITPIQAIIISMIIDHNAELGIDYMADFLGIRNIRMLTYMNEINDLIERRIIRVVRMWLIILHMHCIQPLCRHIWRIRCTLRLPIRTCL